MTCDDAADDGGDADFQRWYFGGSPPESDHWPRHAFEEALQGATVGTVASAVCDSSGHRPFQTERPAAFEMA